MSKADAMPECAAFVRSMREVFGKERGGYACENGIEVSWGCYKNVDMSARRFVVPVLKPKGNGKPKEIARSKYK